MNKNLFKYFVPPVLPKGGCWNKKAEGPRLGLFFKIGMFIYFGLLIAAGSWVIFNSVEDVREIQCEDLVERLINAVVKNGYLVEGVLEDDFNILDKANIDETVLNSDFYFNLKILKNGEEKRSFVFGRKSFEVESKLEGDKMPKSFQRRLVVLDENNEKYEIIIFSASNQLGGEFE